MYRAGHLRALGKRDRFQPRSGFWRFDFFFTAEIHFRFARPCWLEFFWTRRLDFEHLNRNAHRNHLLRGFAVENSRFAGADALVIANELNSDRRFHA